MGYTCKILTIDGGGIRGVIPSYFLQQLEAALGVPTYQMFDIIGGTSTGGLIAIAVTTPSVQQSGYQPPMPASEVLNFYMNDRDAIFVYQGEGVETAEYYSTSLWMQNNVPIWNLSQVPGLLAKVGGPQPTQVFTTGFSVSPATPYLFNWHDAATTGGPDDYYTWEAAFGTSSAPTYFPVAAVGKGAGAWNAQNSQNGNVGPTPSNAAFQWIADGGVVTNDPALWGLREAGRLGLLTNLADVLIVSLGTGSYNGGIRIPAVSGDTGNWGSFAWGAGFDNAGNDISPLVDTFGESNELLSSMILPYLVPSGNYLRLQPPIPYSQSALDGTDQKALLATATNYIKSGGPGYGTFNQIVAALQ